jgi:hypothetical protein
MEKILNGNPIDLDSMYFKGGFYKGEVQRPKLIFDINPRNDDIAYGNAEQLPIQSGTITYQAVVDGEIVGIPKSFWKGE